MAATVTFFVAAEVVRRVNGSNDDNKTYRLLTQGVTCFLIAMSANTVNDGFKKKYEPLKIFILREPLGLLKQLKKEWKKHYNL